MTLIEGKEILGSFDASLREYAARKLIKQGVQLRKGVVKHMDGKTIVLQVGGSICCWSRLVSGNVTLILCKDHL